MLAAESTFIFPAGLQVPAAGEGAGKEAEMGGSSVAVGGAGQLGEGSTGVAAWDAVQQLGQVLVQRTTSAPGYSSSKAGEAISVALMEG